MSNNPKQDIVNITCYMKFHPKPSILSQNIKQKPFFVSKQGQKFCQRLKDFAH